MNNSLGKYSDLGILLLRLSSGLIFILIHGLGKLTGGKETWRRIGGVMKNIGIDFFHEFWGFMAMFSEFFVPMLIILGLFYRPSLLLIIITMFMAAYTHLYNLDPWGKIAYPMMMFFVFTSMFIIGPGKYSIDYLLKKRKQRNEI